MISHFAQSSSYSANLSSSDSSSVALILLLTMVPLVILALIAYWKMFEKAGYAGWKALIPFYNVYITLKMCGMSGWYMILLFIPYVSFLAYIPVAYKLSKSFGFGIGMTILQIFGIGTLIIGLGSSKYIGPGGNPDADSGKDHIDDTPYPKTNPMPPSAAK